MYSLTIHFGPNAICWAFLFKDKEKVESIFDLLTALDPAKSMSFEDDFGQRGWFEQTEVRGVLLEDLDLIEAARIQRSLAEERCKVKLMAAAKNDPVIGEAIRQQQRGAPVLTPMGGFRQ